jgi:hypothetical protein
MHLTAIQCELRRDLEILTDLVHIKEEDRASENEVLRAFNNPAILSDILRREMIAIRGTGLISSRNRSKHRVTRKHTNLSKKIKYILLLCENQSLG